MKRSGTAITLNIKNEPGPEEIRALRAITITSGYRCRKLNRVVGGAINSQHLRGEAADIFIPSTETGRKYFEFIRYYTPFDQLIWEPRGALFPRWLHVSFTLRRKNRGEILV